MQHLVESTVRKRKQIANKNFKWYFQILCLESLLFCLYEATEAEDMQPPETYVNIYGLT